MENIKPLTSSDLAEITEKYSPYLSEARKRVYYTLIVFVSAMFFGFVFYKQIIRYLLDILSLDGVNIVFTTPFQFINLAISSAIVVGLIVIVPLAVIQILYFLRPALLKKEFRMVVRFLPFILILFVVGFTFGIYVMKWQIEISLKNSLSLGIGNVLDITKFLSTVLLTSTFMGIIFQFPIILLIFLRIRIINRYQLAKKRKWIYVGSLFIIILLPLDSILADLLLALPIILLFELTLLLDRILDKKEGERTSQ